MSAGDFLVRRNNADTSVVPNAGSNLDAAWDTQVGISGSGISYSAGVFTLTDVATYLVLFSERFNTTDTTNNTRIEIQSRLILGGTEQVNGAGQAYIRKSSGQQDGCIQSSAIIRTTSTSTSLLTRYYRTDSSTSSTPNRVANYGGSITIIQLDDSFSYGRYVRTTNTALPSVAAAVTFDSNAQEDTGFSRSGATITITTAGRYLVTYNSIMTSTSTTTRQEPLLRLSLDGGSTIVDGTWSQTFLRGNESTQTGAVSWSGVIDVSASDTLQLIENNNAGSTSTSIDTVLNIVQLPVGNETFIINASTNNFNTAAATDFQWASAVQLDTAAFTYSTNSTNVDVDNADDYLVFASQSNTGVAASRAYPTARFAVNNVINTQAVDGSYGRSSGSADAPALNTATLLIGLSTNDSIESVNDSLASNSTVISCSSGQFSGIRLSSLFAISTTPTITDVEGDEEFNDKDTAITLTGTNYEATQNTGTVEIGSHSTYTLSTTKIAQTVTSWADTSIDVTAVLSTLTPGSLWMYVTNDTGDTNETGFAVTVHRAAAFAMSLSSNFADGDATTAQLIAPATKTTGDFVAGEMNETSNPAAAIDITADDYTEIEWSLQATADSDDSAVYLFRVTDNGTVLDTYTVTPEWTIDASSGTSIEVTLETLALTSFNTVVDNPIPTDITVTLESLSLTAFNASVEALVNTNVPVTLETLSLTPFNSTVEALIDTNVLATLEALNLTSFNPSVEVLISTDIAATLETLTLTSFNATVQTLTGIDIAVTLETLTLAAINPTVSVLVDLNINATLETLSLTPISPIVQAGVDVDISVSLESLALTAFNPVVTALISNDISVTLETLSLTPFNSTVEALEDVNIPVSIESLTLTSFNTTVEAGLDNVISVTLESLSLTTFNPAVEALVSTAITVSLESLSLTSFNANIEALVNTNINATIESLNLIGFNTSVFFDTSTNINATTASLTLASFNVVVEANLWTDVDITNQTWIDDTIGTQAWVDKVESTDTWTDKTQSDDDWIDVTKQNTPWT